MRAKKWKLRIRESLAYSFRCHVKLLAVRLAALRAEDMERVCVGSNGG